MKECPRGFHLVRRITLRVTGDGPLMAIVLKFRYQKVLGIFATEGGKSSGLGVPYLSRYPEHYSSVSICHVLCHHAIRRHFSACNAIDNYKRIR